MTTYIKNKIKLYKIDCHFMSKNYDFTKKSFAIFTNGTKEFNFKT